MPALVSGSPAELPGASAAAAAEIMFAPRAAALARWTMRVADGSNDAAAALFEASCCRILADRCASSRALLPLPCLRKKPASLKCRTAARKSSSESLGLVFEDEVSGPHQACLIRAMLSQSEHFELVAGAFLLLVLVGFLTTVRRFLSCCWGRRHRPLKAVRVLPRDGGYRAGGPAFAFR